MRYSLANHIMTVKIPQELVGTFGAETLSIGGEGSYLDYIEIRHNSDLWSTEGSACGGFSHSKNLDATGTCTISITQLTDVCFKLRTLCNLYRTLSTNTEALRIEVSTLDNDVLVTCEDCLIQKQADMRLGQSADKQSWNFTCGKITFN